MRKNFIRVFAAAALTLSFAACSQDDIAPNVITPEMATSYMKVDIAMAGGTGTRAVDENKLGEMAAGTEEESAINKLTLLLYADEVLVGTGTTSIDQKPELSDDKGIEKTKDGLVMKLTLEPSKPLPNKMYAFINTDASYATEKEAKDAILNANQIESDGTNFVMTNALKRDLSDIGITIEEDQIKDNEQEARDAKPIKIYVERLAAKITVQSRDAKIDQSNVNYKLVGVDGTTEYTLDFIDAKWAPTGTAKQMYSLKHAWTDLSDVNDDWALGGLDYRNYWAKGVYYDWTYAAVAGKETDYVEHAQEALEYVSANNAISANGIGKSINQSTNATFAYVPEHTFGKAARNGDEFAPKVTGTNAIVVGRYEVTGNDADKFKVTYENGNEEGHTVGTYYDFYLTLKGNVKGDTEGDEETTTEKNLTVYYIYSRAEMIKHVLEDINGINVTDLTVDDSAIEDLCEVFDITKEKGQTQYFVKIKEGKEVMNGEEGKLTNESLSKGSNGRHYYNGWAYFFAPIKHNAAPTADDKSVGTYGVVRNHSYVLTINSINTLGAALDETKVGSDPEGTDPDDPGEDPGDDPIIPDPDEIKDVWINSTINVLSWHVVSQDVEL